MIRVSLSNLSIDSFNTDVSGSASEKQFSILYGHKGGSGSLGKAGQDGARDTAVVYGQMLNLTQPPETELFTFENGTDVTKQHIYALSKTTYSEEGDPQHVRPRAAVVEYNII